MYKEAIRPAWVEVNLSNLDYNIKNIRAKLRTAGVAAPETVLKTIWGVGYQWKSET